MKHQRRLVSVLLVMLMLFSAFSAAMTASAEDGSVCMVSVSVVGDGTISGNGQSSKELLVLELPVGSTVTIDAVPSEGFEPLYWVNLETNRVVSFDSSYTISVSHDQDFELTFDREQSLAAANGSHRIVYLSSGHNIIYSASVPIGSTDYINRISPSFVFVSGKTFTGWDHTEAEVAADSGRVFVYPVYSSSGKAFTVTKIIGSEITKEQISYGENGKPGTCIMQAPISMDGKPFSYWIEPADPEKLNSRDQIASVLRNYSFGVEMDVTLKAVYGADDVPPYITRVAGDLPDFENDTVLIRTERSVSLDYTVSDSGVLFSRTPIGSPDEFVLNSGNPDINTGTAKEKSQTGSYSFTITKWNAKDPMTDGYYYPLLYVRSWLQVKDKSGNITTVYSNIYCVDYINMDYIGPEWDNYDDPFG